MAIQRQHGAEHPYWPLGPFKVRLPFIHYRWEFPEMVQGLFMFVVSLGMIPLLMKYLGMPYEAALAFCVVAGIGYLLPALLGVPLVPGWITPAIPVVLLFLQGFEPGPEAVKAMFALQVEVFMIFLVLGLTGLGNKLVTFIPNSLKWGIIIGAGIAAMMGELKTGGRIDATPISLYRLDRVGLRPVLAVVQARGRDQQVRQVGLELRHDPRPADGHDRGLVLGEYPLPKIEWGHHPARLRADAQLPGVQGRQPTMEMFLLAIPTAIIAYVIAFGDILVGFTLCKRVHHLRQDEKIELDVTRVHR